MKIEGKKFVALSGVVCILGLMAAGCGAGAGQAERPGNAGTDAVSDETAAAAVDADFEGTVVKIDADAFYIMETQTEILEDGSMLAVETSTEGQIPESDMIQVVFEENPHFCLRTIYEGGARYEDAEASFHDVKEDMSVDLKGEFVGDIFHAKEIRLIQIGK